MRNSNVIIAVTALFVTVGGLAVCFASCDKTKGNEKNESVSYGMVEQDKGPVSGRGVVEIREKLFMAQVDDVYENAKDYLGRTIKLEGIFKKEEWLEDTYCYVLRYGPGCCGDDFRNVGFEVKLSEDFTDEYPDTDSWVSAEGVLKVGKLDRSYQYLYLDLSSLDVLSKRGAEFVRQ
jgi:uncharacterized membrane protein YcgQ (UPF0703/DUF1980 family)